MNCKMFIGHFFIQEFLIYRRCTDAPRANSRAHRILAKTQYQDQLLPDVRVTWLNYRSDPIQKKHGFQKKHGESSSTPVSNSNTSGPTTGARWEQELKDLKPIVRGKSTSAFNKEDRARHSSATRLRLSGAGECRTVVSTNGQVGLGAPRTIIVTSPVSTGRAPLVTVCRSVTSSTHYGTSSATPMT